MLQLFCSLPRQSSSLLASVLTVEREIICSNSVSMTSTEGLMYVFIALRFIGYYLMTTFLPPLM